VFARACVAVSVALALCLSTLSCATKPADRSAARFIHVDPEILKRHVHELAVTFHPRSFDHPANLEAAGDYILAQFESAHAKTEIQNVEANSTTYRNIIAHYGPETGPLIVIGAHYDSNADTPGADDNASGVAGLLELARLMSTNPPTRPVQLVAYTLEEPPFFRTNSMGSMWHARSLHDEKREVQLMISLEMIGYFRDESNSQKYPFSAFKLLYPDEGNFVALVGRLKDFGILHRVKTLFRNDSALRVISINAPTSLNGVDFSDHSSFWKYKMPAIMVTDTAFLRNPNYHGAGDTPDTLDYVRMAQVVQAVYAVATGF
jgi:Zn-dependent M28 family amino/carboxypeptidase